MPNSNVAPIQNFDSKQILANPKFQAFKDAIKNNPEQYKQWLVYSETQNPLTISNGGKEVIDDIISSFDINPDQLNQMFDPNTLPDNIKQQIDKNPEEAFKTTYNQYTYGKDNVQSKLKIRMLNSYAKNKLIEQGKNPDDILNKNPFISGLNFLANLVSVPPNLLAKGYASIYDKSDKVKIWGGGGWEDAFKAVDNDPYLKELITKTSQNIPLTLDEKKKLKEYDNQVAPIGLLFNIIADPTLIAGAIGKGIGLAAKGMKGLEGASDLFKISKAFEMFSQPFKTIKDISLLKNLKTTGEIDNVVKTSLTTAKELVGNILNSSRLNQIDNVLKETKITDIPKSVQLLDDISNVAKQFGKIQEASQISKANDLLKESLFKMKTISESKTLSGLAKKYESFKNIINSSVEKSGLRKIFLSEVPLEAKPIMDKARRLHAGLEGSYFKLNNDLIKHKNSLKNEIMKTPKIKEFVNKNTLGIKSVDDMISEMIEKPKFAKEMSIKFNIGTKAITDINKVLDDHIIQEAKYVGKKAMPMLSSEVGRKEYSKLADEFMRLNNENKYHPDLPKIENDMRKLLSEKTNINNLNGDTIDMLTENVNYLTHVMTPEAKKIYLELDTKSMGKTGEYFRSYVSNPSFRQRGLQGSRAEIDKYIIGKDGEKYTPFAQDVLKDAEGIKISDPVAYKEKIDFANKINELGIRLRKSGGRFFDSNIDKLLAVRSARSARTIQQAVFYDGIKQFASDTGFKDGIKLEKPRVNIPGLMDKYFHPDIARAIEEFYNITSDDRGVKKIFNFMRQFQTFWKSTTLAFPATVLRNILGNIMNSFLVVDNPAKFIDSFKDAVLATKGKTYNIITNSGKHLGLNSIFKEAEQRGIMGTTLVSTDIMKEIQATENTKGVIGQGLRTVAKGINAAIPFSKMNEAAESYSKLALFIERVKSGKSFDEAADEVFKVLFDYGDLTSLDKSIKNVMPFWCVPDDTEILTNRGWIKPQEINIGIDKTPIYYHYEGIVRWKPINKIAFFDYDGLLMSIEDSRNGKFLFTPNHGFPVFDHDNKRYLVKGYELRTNHRIPIVSEFTEWPEESEITEFEANILGWILTDGYIDIDKRRVVLYQSKKRFVKQIDILLKDKASKYISKREKENHEDMSVWTLRNPLKERILQLLPNKHDPMSLINKLNENTANILWESMYNGDGTTSIRNDGKNHCEFFAQRPGKIFDLFQIISILLNRVAQQNDRGCYIRNDNKTMKVGYKLNTEWYKGKIWCPELEGNCWYMRRNGKVILSQNTWTRKNLPLQISNLLSIPSRTIVKMENNFNQSRPSDDLTDKRYMSNWLASAPTMRIGKDKTGKPTYLLLEGLVPFFDISRLLRAGAGISKEGALGGLSALVDDTVKDMSPLIKTPIELITNRDFAFHKDIEKSKYATTEFLGFEVSPKLKAVLNDWRYLNTLNKGINVNKLISNNTGVSSTPDKDMAKMLFSWALGSTVPYDVNYSKIVASRDTKSHIDSEINDFSGYIKKIKNGMMQGQKLNKGNAEHIRGRLKNIFLMINNGFADARIEKQDRGRYAAKLYKAFKG